MPLTQPFPFGIETSRLVWHRLIQQYGDLALLRQHGIPDRYISYMPAQFTLNERLGGISNPADRKVLISEISPDTGVPLTPEPSEKDVLVTILLNEDGTPDLDTHGNPQEDERLKIVAPPARVGPSRHELYWRLQVRS